MQLLLDGSDSNTASIALGYADSAGAGLRARRCGPTRRTGRAAGALQPPVDARLRVWYNSSLESRNYIVPGLIAVILMIIAALLTSLTIAREWEMGTMEQLLSTPLRPAEMVLGKMLAYFVVGLADTAIVVVAGIARVSGAVPRQRPAAGAFRLPVPVRRAVLGHLHFRAGAQTQLLAYQMGADQFVPAGVSALRIHVLDREHAAGDPGDHAHRAGALLRHHSERHVPERRGIRRAVGARLVFLVLYAAIVFCAGDAQVESEAGVNHVGTHPRHSAQGIPAGAARAAHARAAVPAAADPADHLRLRREPGRGSRAHRLDGSGPHAGEPRSAGALRGLGPLRRGGARRATSDEVRTLLDRGEVQAVVRVLPGLRARHGARPDAPQVQVLVDGTNSNTASLVSSYAGAGHRAVLERGAGRPAAERAGADAQPRGRRRI